MRAAAASHLQKLAKFYDGVSQTAERRADFPGFLHVGLYQRPDESEADAQLGLVLRAASHVALERDDDVLDVGCGLGMPAVVLAEKFGVRVTALTISAGQAQFARRLAEHRQLCERVRPVVADAHRLPIASGSCRAAFALESLLHMDRKLALGEMRRSLRDHGDLVLCDWVQTGEVSEAETLEVQRSFLMNGVSLTNYLQLLSEAGFIDLGYEDWSAQIAPTYDRWAANVPLFTNVVPILRHKFGYVCIWAKAG